MKKYLKMIEVQSTADSSQTMLCYVSNFWPQKLKPPLTKSWIHV